MRRALSCLTGPLVVLALARSATATPYETFIDISDQADLEDLLAAGEISTDTFDELLDLLGNGVDLDTANREELYALPNLTYEDVDKILSYRQLNKGKIGDPAALVAAGALSQDKLLAISAFVVTHEARDRYGLKGWVRAMTRFSSRDQLVPPLAMRARFSGLEHLQAGFAAVMTRLQPGSPQYDPTRDALIADQVGYRAAVPKLYLKYEDDQAAVIGGSYRIGFGQRLVFDTTSRYTPNGITFDDQLFFSSDLTSFCKESGGELAASPCDNSEGGDRDVSPDWRWRDGLFGVAAGFKKLGVGSAGWLQGYAWASAVNRYAYQYELVDRGKCADPSNDADPNCAAPNVFVRPDGDPLQDTSRFTFVTLPDVFQERVAGGNVSYFADRRNSVGLTAYAATETSLVDGIDLDTQEWSRIPTGGQFGAAGANFAFGRGWLDVFGEAAFSFDKIPDTEGPQAGGGGAAAILRVTATRKKEELEAVFRYYGIDYVNPFARPISAPDELDGQRARDEVGVRVRYYRRQKLYSLRASLDVWEPPSQRDPSKLGRSQPKLDTYVRGDVQTSQEIQLGLWLRYQDKDLQSGGHAECFEVSTEFDENGEPIACGGRQITSVGQVRYRANRQMSYSAMLQYQLLDDPVVSDTGFRTDWSGWLVGLWYPAAGVRVRGRVRYFEEAAGAINSAGLDQGETSLSALVDAAIRLRDHDQLRVRADYKQFLDSRTSTVTRDPNPQLQVWLSYEARL